MRAHLRHATRAAAHARQSTCATATYHLAPRSSLAALRPQVCTLTLTLTLTLTPRPQVCTLALTLTLTLTPRPQVCTFALGDSSALVLRYQPDGSYAVGDTSGVMYHDNGAPHPRHAQSVLGSQPGLRAAIHRSRGAARVLRAALCPRRGERSPRLPRSPRSPRLPRLPRRGCRSAAAAALWSCPRSL